MLNSLFIESPICLTKCSYCRYFRGLGTQRDVDEYFDNILPGFLRRPDIREELYSRDYFDVYFGGGTPTLASAEQWRSIFDLVPLEKCAVRCFEGSVFSLDERHVRLCAERGFHYMSIGGQVTQRRSMEKNNRQAPSLERVRECVGLIERHGMICNVDLLCGINHGDERDVPAFMEELRRTMEDIRPISVTVNVKFPVLEPLPLHRTLLRELAKLDSTSFCGYDCVSGSLDDPEDDSQVVDPPLIPDYRFMRDRREFLFRMVTQYVPAEFCAFVTTMCGM